MFLHRLAADADQNGRLASAMGRLRIALESAEIGTRVLESDPNSHRGRLRKCVAHAERCSTQAEVPKDMFHRWTVVVAASVTVSLETLAWQHQTALGLPKRVDSSDWNGGRACLADPSSRRRLEQCSALARAVLFVSHQRAKAEAASFMRMTLH
jgi:hypothetical protein